MDASSAAKAAKGDEALADTEAVSVRTIQRQYEENGVGADLQYKGRRLKLTGTVKEVSKDAWGKIYVKLQYPNMFSSPSAYFAESEQMAVAQLRKGQTIEFVGTIDGLWMGDVHIKNCRLL